MNAQYRTCLDEGKTERECVKKTIELAEAEGERAHADHEKHGGAGAEDGLALLGQTALNSPCL